jgi:hypothetical protein
MNIHELLPIKHLHVPMGLKNYFGKTARLAAGIRAVKKWSHAHVGG